MSKKNCEKCNSYDITFCSADQDTCYTESDEGDDRACAYMLCRKEVLEFLISDTRE